MQIMQAIGLILEYYASGSSMDHLWGSYLCLNNSVLKVDHASGKIVVDENDSVTLRLVILILQLSFMKRNHEYSHA